MPASADDAAAGAAGGDAEGDPVDAVVDDDAACAAAIGSPASPYSRAPTVAPARRRRLIAQCCSQLSGEALNRLYEQVVEFAIKEVGDGLKFDNRVLRGGRFHVDLDKYGV